MKASFDNLKTMALAYNSFADLATDAMRDDILYGLEFMLKDYYATGKSSTGNWWEWEIGVPKVLYDTLSLMEGHITDAQQAQFAGIVTMANDATRWFVPDPRWQHYGEGATREPMAAEGANKVDLSLVVLMRGAFEQNDADIKMAIDALPTVLAPVTKANGFYDDGSFIQHANIPYIGTYGVTLLSGIGKVMNAITDTGIDLSDPQYAMIDEYLFSAVEPFMYEGKMMDAVSGRAIARGWVQNHGEGRSASMRCCRFMTPAALRCKGG
ncbi:hyaluronate lyase precursor [Photobacterium aphoticum]|uniref:Hyaluronate lyase n=1 Tax=Photobacterium aphoticum TaxID=754436 RepID=A0A090QWC4_9GAMM|nr:hyaluronate lyase precursor [Photobacterium aphoticum]